MNIPQDRTPKNRQEVADELAAFIATASPELLSVLGLMAGHSRQDQQGEEAPA
ncbi:hypothetical protein ACFP81_06535 [Deinococcus lacus]|uniref:Uncharacterized protein n=1 Tax=Deinococcus lacus TaxID=392561 RepID=A0ABW1YBT7_9DEIO